MSYYIGFRHGWVAIGRHVIAWHDSVYYPNFGKGYRIGHWKVRWS